MSLLDTNLDPVLSARQLTRRYGSRIGCKDVSLDLWPGEVLGIVGESGSGKSTLLNMLSGRLEPSAGYVHYTAADGKVLDIHSLDAAQRRLSELATLVQRIYEDNVFGRLSDDLYQTLSAKYEAETKELKTRAAEIQALLTEATTKTQGIQDFTDLVAPYADITELDEELVHTLIEKIIVHEKEIINGETVMRIEIYYRFIGKTSDCLNRSVTPIKTKTESVAATDSIA